MGKIIKAKKRGGGIESKVIEEYTPLKIGLNLYLPDIVHKNKRLPGVKLYLGQTCFRICSNKVQ